MDTSGPPPAAGVRVGHLLLGSLLAAIGAAVFLVLSSGPASAQEADGDGDGTPVTLDTQIVDDSVGTDEEVPPPADEAEDPGEITDDDGDRDAVAPDAIVEDVDDTGPAVGTDAGAPLTLDAQPDAGLDTGAAVPEAPDCGTCRSTIDQELVDRTFDTDHWTVVIEATLDSNVVCHLFLFQCVVQPEQAPTDMALVSVECLSPGWAHVYIDVLGFTRNVCARFDHHHAGTDQRFRFTYRTDPGVVSGTVSEKVVFYRFPEEIFFVRASDTITIDLDVELDVTKTCPDVVTAGSSGSCTITLSYPGQGPALTPVTVSDTPPAEFLNGTLVHVSGSGTWNCIGLTCTLVGSYSPGDTTTFGFSFDVASSADGEVSNTANASWNTGSASDDAVVTVRQPTDTTLSIIKVVEGGTVRPGDPVAWRIIVTNEGPVDAVNVRVADMPGGFVQRAVMAFESGVGSWACSDLECTTALMPLGDAVFVVRGFVAGDAPPGTVITNEAEVEWDNDVFGPDFPIRVGAQVIVAEAPLPPEPPEPPAPPHGPASARTLPVTGSGDVPTLLLVAGILLLAGLTLQRAGTRDPQMGMR